jgi:hypothetical protein
MKDCDVQGFAAGGAKSHYGVIRIDSGILNLPGVQQSAGDGILQLTARKMRSSSIDWNATCAWERL